MAAPDARLISATLLAGLDVRSRADRDAYARLVALLEHSDLADAPDAFMAQRSPTERVEAAAEHPAATVATDEPRVSPEFRVFRREAPIASPASALTVPAWARGAEIAETIGPLRGADGRLFWFDFYRIVRLVPVHFAGDPRPAFLFHLRERQWRPGEPIDVDAVLGFIRRNRYALERGSVWLRADLLAAGSPSGGYVGLRIRGGSLSFAPQVVNVAGRLTIPVGGRCEIRLDLAAPAAPPAGGGAAGRDAVDADLALPVTAGFDLAGGRATVAEVSDARWTLYGQTLLFSGRQNPAPTWEPALLSVFVPYLVSEPAIAVRAAGSPFATPDGAAPIVRAGWTLPVATIDVTDPLDAAGAGGLAVRAAPGLTIGWNGLADGPVPLPSPWVALAPGLILITDTAAASTRARQRLRLWQTSSPPGRSTIDLRYGDPSQLIYLVAASGHELVMLLASLDVHLDRPVDVQGTPFPVHTRRSLAAFTYTDPTRFAFLYDEDILADAIAAAARPFPARGTVNALAIRNALFTTTPVASLLLFATLRDDEMVETGTLMLGMGLYRLLPTLPDPYAANVESLDRDRRRHDSATRVSQLLVASTTWQKATADVEPDVVASGLTFAPLGPHAESVARWGLPPAVAARPAGRAPSSTTTDSPQPALAFRQPSVAPIWDALFTQFSDEQFALLDVSSNADQMGVSFAYFDPRRHPERQGTPFNLVYGGGPAGPANPFEVRDLDLSAQGRFVRAFTVPQVSWDPLLNLTSPDRGGDPPEGLLVFPNDGGPTRFLSDDTAVVPIAPVPVSQHLVDEFANRRPGFTGALFTLPYGLVSFAEFSRVNAVNPALSGSTLALNRPHFEDGRLVGGIQLRADAPPQDGQSPTFRGCTVQLPNLHRADGVLTGAGSLGASVSTIFNEEFFLDGSSRVRDFGVPVTRIDFSGYGASLFSRWEAPNASIASTSQARFDVFVGRTAHEVIQVRTLLYPWGVRVVRTITMLRASSGYTYRWDTGWQPESDGVFDFRYTVKRQKEPTPPPPASPIEIAVRSSPYEFHPGVIRGVFNVRNIRETDALKPFSSTLVKGNGDPYIDQNNFERKVDGSTPLEERSPGVLLQPVYFDGDIEIDGLVAGGTRGRVPSKGILGYVQLKPRGEPLTEAALRDLLVSQFGSIGAAVECEIIVAGSGQRMRISRVDVSPSVDGAGAPIFVVSARGALVLPAGGAWSVVRHQHATGEVSPLDANATVPLIRRGVLMPATRTTDAGAADLFRIANPIDLMRAAAPDTANYGLLQTTGTQKALFRQPSFQQGLDQLLGVAPDYADAYRLINTKGIFPNVQDSVPLALGAFKTWIIAEGYRLRDAADPSKAFTQLLPAGPLKLIDESFLKIYIEYAKTDKKGTPVKPGVLQFGFDSAAAEGQKWLSTVNDIGMVVDLGSIKRLVTIKGRFDAQHGAAPAFREPTLVFADELQPVVDILQILSDLQGGDYAKAMQKGLDIAMSNSAGSWNYAFHARKEFPVVQFPPGELYYAPQTPFKLRAHLAIGAYFNESITSTAAPGQLVPTAGAYLEFGGSLSVMCVSVAAATIYAVGAVDLRIYGDTKAGPGLAMRFGFGAELVVGLPVIGNVSLLFMVGVEVSLDLTQITVSAFLLFRGRAELLGGIVTITIQIEAKGTYQRLIGPPDKTNMIAQVTFAIDISIFLIINLSFSESWQEQRQIA